MTPEGDLAKSGAGVEPCQRVYIRRGRRERRGGTVQELRGGWALHPWYAATGMEARCELCGLDEEAPVHMAHQVLDTSA